MRPTTEDPTAVAGRLCDRFPPGTAIGEAGDVSVVDTRVVDDRVLVLVRWDADPRLYGIPVKLDDTAHDYYFTGLPVDSVTEWIESVVRGVAAETTTGFRAAARRSRGSDHLELSRDGGWPVDDRFAFSEVLGFHTEMEQALTADGINPAVARRARNAGTLRGWVVVSENNLTGARWLGQAVVREIRPGLGLLDDLYTATGVPTSVRCELARLACHMAAAHGMLTVETALDDPDLQQIGFVTAADRRTLDCDFLLGDPDAARRRLADELAQVTPGSRSTPAWPSSPVWSPASPPDTPVSAPRGPGTAR